MEQIIICFLILLPHILIGLGYVVRLRDRYPKFCSVFVALGYFFLVLEASLVLFLASITHNACISSRTGSYLEIVLVDNQKLSELLPAVFFEISAIILMCVLWRNEILARTEFISKCFFMLSGSIILSFAFVPDCLSAGIVGYILLGGYWIFGGWAFYRSTGRYILLGIALVMDVLLYFNWI